MTVEQTALNSLIGCLNAALEHVPPTTREMIAQCAKPHGDTLKALVDRLAESPKP